MMQQWTDAILRDPSFRQQLDPVTGDFTQSGSASYSPCALVLYDYTWRLAGVRREVDARSETAELHWNIRPTCAAAQNATFRLPLKSGTAELRYTQNSAELRLNNALLARIHGTARLVTSSPASRAISSAYRHSRHRSPSTAPATSHSTSR